MRREARERSREKNAFFYNIVKNLPRLYGINPPTKMMETEICDKV